MYFYVAYFRMNECYAKVNEQSFSCFCILDILDPHAAKRRKGGVDKVGFLSVNLNIATQAYNAVVSPLAPLVEARID